MDQATTSQRVGTLAWGEIIRTCRYESKKRCLGCTIKRPLDKVRLLFENGMAYRKLWVATTEAFV